MSISIRAYARLKKGRFYGDEKRGEYALRWKSKSGPFFNNIVDVPCRLRSGEADAVARATARRGGPAVAQSHLRAMPACGTNLQAGQPARTGNRIEGEKQIYFHPSGWAAAQWWDEEQVDNILRGVDALKRKYNIDESRIYLTGISDGGTGVYYMALKEPNLWSSYLPLNGSIAVIRSPQNGADGEMYGNNLVERAVLHRQRRAGQPVPGLPGRAAHQVVPVAWACRSCFARRPAPATTPRGGPPSGSRTRSSCASMPRVAHPATLSWETERTDKFNRNRWLVINELRQDASRETELKDRGFFQHTKLSGRVDVIRAGNTFEAKVRDVAAFTLLLSPDAVDFSQADRRDGQRQAVVQRHGEEGSGHAAALVGPRQRSHHALRRRTQGRRTLAALQGNPKMIRQSVIASPSCSRVSPPRRSPSAGPST